MYEVFIIRLILRALGFRYFFSLILVLIASKVIQLGINLYALPYVQVAFPTCTHVSYASVATVLICGKALLHNAKKFRKLKF